MGVTSFRVWLASGAPLAFPDGRERSRFRFPAEFLVLGCATPLEAWRLIDRQNPELGRFIVRVERQGAPCSRRF